MLIVYILVLLGAVGLLGVTAVYPKLLGGLAGTKAKQKRLATALIGVIGSLAVAMATGSLPVDDRAVDSTVPEVTVEDITQAPNPEPLPPASPAPSRDLEAAVGIAAVVRRVVDGDTLHVTVNGETETIRVIGLNTPETVDPRRPVECFGKEASAQAHALLDNQTIKLVADASQGDRDKYGRLLRYVTLSDGSDFGEHMLGSGYGYEYTYAKPYTRQGVYKAAQTQASQNNLGLWSDETGCE